VDKASVFRGDVVQTSSLIKRNGTVVDTMDTLHSHRAAMVMQLNHQLKTLMRTMVVTLAMATISSNVSETSTSAISTNVLEQKMSDCVLLGLLD
jgi:hypothetical protein